MPGSTSGWAADRLLQFVLAVVVLGLFGGELAQLDQAIDQRLIARQLHEPALRTGDRSGCRRRGRR